MGVSSRIIKKGGTLLTSFPDFKIPDQKSAWTDYILELVDDAETSDQTAPYERVKDGWRKPNFNPN